MIQTQKSMCSPRTDKKGTKDVSAAIVAGAHDSKPIVVVF